MDAAFQIALIRQSTVPPESLTQGLAAEGFRLVSLETGHGLLPTLAELGPAAVLIDGTFDDQRLETLHQQVLERLAHVPVLLLLPASARQARQPRNLPPVHAVVYTDAPPGHMAASLRGAIKTAFTVRELVSSNRKLNEISITDSLTGLYNRGYMMNRLGSEFKRSQRNNTPLSCLMIDLDYFKQVNDTYGHKFGDIVLQAVAGLFRTLIRETDIFGRYGGEEFVIILPGTNLQGAHHLAEKLRSELESVPIRHECFAVTVTASFGAASTELPEVVAPDHLLQLSDRALYRAKETGRNRVCVTGPKTLLDETDSGTPDASSLEVERHPRIDALHTGDYVPEWLVPLQRSGEYRVEAHRDVESLMRAVQSTAPSLILLEHAPDRVDALELCRRIKAHYQDLFVPVVVCMEDADPAVCEAAFDVGADDVFPGGIDCREQFGRLRSLERFKELHDRWRNTYNDLTRTRTRLIRVERLSALGEMASGMAHDFNNLLSAILGRTQLLRHATNDPNLRQNLQIIEQAATKGVVTIRRIQEFAKATPSRLFEPLDLAEIVQDSIQMTRSRWKDDAERRGLRYRFYTDFEDTCMVRGNAPELREVVTNLILNALDAMPGGGEMHFEGHVQEEQAVLVVRDTGTGMGEEVVKRVFDPFFSTKEGRGSGLGLSVAYGVIQRHNGRIECSSTPGKGTSFRIELPLHRVMSSAESSPAAAAASGEETRRLKVLIVDDEVAIREIFREFVEGEGHQAKTVESGEEALKRLDEEDPDLVITDLSMPGMSGWEVARQARKARPAAMIVLMSGWGADFSLEQMRQHGVDRVLAKPVPFDALSAVLRQAAERKRDLDRTNADAPADATGAGAAARLDSGAEGRS